MHVYFLVLSFLLSLSYSIMSIHCTVPVVVPNGYVYETFGISKHNPVKLQLLLIRDGTLYNVLTAKCFIHDVELNLR